MDMLRMLDFTELFGGLSDSSKKMLAEIAIPKNLNKGETLFSEGDQGFALYILGSGSIQLSKSGSDDKMIVVKIVQPGEVFAEVILFEKNCYPVSAVALKSGIVFILPKQQFYCLLENTSFRNDFIVLLMHKQRYLTERLMQVQSHEVDERFFLFLKNNYGQKDKITPGISKKDIAAAIGTTPETLSRLLFRLKQENFLQWEGKEMVISNEFWKMFEKRD
jgi:CRP/FNR family transcriptional regulator